MALLSFMIIFLMIATVLLVIGIGITAIAFSDFYK